MEGLTFNPENHEYRYNNQIVPSVTQILDPYSGLEHVPEEILRPAAELGNHVHDACDLFDRDGLNMETLDPVLAPYVAAWATFLEDTGAVTVESERRVFSQRLGYAGTLDRVLFWGNSNRLVDIKTATTMPKTTGPQTAAYAKAYTAETSRHITRRYGVQLKPDGSYKLHRYDDPAHWQVFKAALTLHRWRN